VLSGPADQDAASGPGTGRPAHQASRRARVLAALTVLAAVLAVQGPSLLPGKVALFADGYAVPPWSALAPPEGSGHPRLVTDSIRYTYPAWEFAHDELWAGRLPLWNPYVFCGHDWAGSIQPAVFYPARLALSFLPPGRGMTLYVVLHTLLLALATLAWLLGRGSGAAAAAAGGIVVALSGYVLAKMGQPSIVVALAWLPVMLWLVDRLVDRPSVRLAGGLAGAGAMCLLSGHPQMFLFVLVTVFLFGSAAVARWRMSSRDLRRRIPLVLLAVAVALAGSSAQIVAYLSSYPGSRGVQGEEPPPPLLRPRVEGLLSVLAPEPFGSPGEGTFRHVQAADSAEQPGKRRIWHTGSFLYPGVLVLLLAPLAMAAGFRHKFAIEGLVLVLASYAFVFLDPIADLLMSVPGLGFAPVDRLLAVGAFGWAVLAAAGVDALGRAPRLRTLGLLVAGGVGVAALLAGLLLWGSVPAEGSSSLIRTLLLLVLTLAVLATASGWGRLRPVAPLLALLLLAVDLLPLARGYFPAVEAEEVLPPTRTTSFLQRQLGGGRIVRFDTEALRANTASVFDLRDAQGFSPFYSGDYRSLLRVFLGTWPDPRRVNALEDPATLGSQLLPLLGVRHAVSQRPLRHPHWRLVFHDEGLFVSESRRAAPRVRVVERWRWVDGREAAARAMLEPGYSPLTEAVLLRREGVATPQPPARPETTPAVARARIVREATRRLEIEVEAPRGGWLVLADTYHPAWRAVVNGERAPVHQAYLALRAVTVPPGRSDVVFEYRPTAVMAAWGLSWAAWLSMAGLLLVPSGGSLLRRLRRRVR
jgi:hypothetical protein